MKFAIISGSTRNNEPQSSKVAKYVKHYLESQMQQSTYLLDFSATSLKYWDETFWTDYKNFDPAWSAASAEIRSSDALVVISPEWNGMIPPALKNFFHLAVKGEIANKPAMLIGVSSGMGGTYPICELRLNGYKNTYVNFIPQHVIVRNATAVLNDFTKVTDESDKLTRERIDYTLRILQVYAQAFVSIRESDVIKNNPFPYGM